MLEKSKPVEMADEDDDDEEEVEEELEVRAGGGAEIKDIKATSKNK